MKVTRETSLYIRTGYIIIETPYMYTYIYIYSKSRTIACATTTQSTFFSKMNL